ncbi:gamma-glutamyltransferase family protein [Ancylobacter dichloromethanicus]|uniref:Gamma-glutamyltranspeptidase n=1 Tax=Ancylobacter dichloromethanicus TaxID=518825 RepID=A0A9W6JBW3_9HYPH|nr:gamma-glutamyltransferase family protein [Ancylobacter dichloromethanicus]MBS7553142.1 gamma-glutamyltransferase family protein [Ancylobacter dichloromethanicus]GLK72919.1 gamma-glutamyltranspeptidase [Ancylobacter dichloromethanicus]
MLNTVRARRGMVTSPHHLASEAGLRVLREGGNAVEATIAMAATLAVVYPHMTAIGGDGFWLVGAPGEEPVAIDACSRAAAAATPELYLRAGLAAIPQRGPLAANTTAGTVAGWGEALALSVERGGTLPLSRLVEDAVWHARNGFAVTASQSELTAQKLPELGDVSGFADAFLVEGQAPATGASMTLPALGETLHRIGDEGTDSFYRGALAREIAHDLATAGTPVTLADLSACRAQRVAPLSVDLPGIRLTNFPPPTQGLASLMILALFSRLGAREAESFDHLHGLVEATKQAFLVRDRLIGDPDAMTGDPRDWLTDTALDRLAARIDPQRALAWPAAPSGGDTVWLGAIDGDGLATSFIQSIYFEFGSGVVLPQTGIVWQNRGSSFQLRGKGPRVLAPGRKPFHTLNPAMARFADGRHMVYGTMGGEGQPQTQAALFSRYGLFGQELQAAITAPRWLLGRTWGAETVTLKLEDRFPPELVDALRAAGHEVETVAPFDAMMGHAGAIVRQPDGRLEGASDPRSDGAAMGF